MIRLLLFAGWLSGGAVSASEAKELLPSIWGSRLTFVEAIDWIGDPDPTRRQIAVREMSRLKEPKAIPYLTRALADPAPLVRQYAASTLFKPFGHREALPLIMTLVHDPHVPTRRTIVRILGQWGLPEGLPVLGRVAMAETEESPIRMEAVESIRETGSPEALTLLAGVLGAKNTSVREMALSSIVALNEFDTGNLMMTLLRHKDPRTRAGAFSVLIQLPSFDAYPVVLEALEGSDHPMKLMAIGALARFTTPETVDRLTQYLADPDSGVMAAAAGALLQADHPLTAPGLIALLQTPGTHASQRLRAALQLGTWGILESLPALRAALNDPDTNVRRAARRSLDALGETENSPFRQAPP